MNPAPGSAPSDPPAAPDLATLTGVRSGKRSYYREYLRSDERTRRAVRAMDSISRAVVRTVEGPRALLEEVARAAAAHVHAHWVVLAVADRHLLQARPRFLVVDPRGAVFDDADALPPFVRGELAAVRAGSPPPTGAAEGWVRVPMTLEGRTMGSLVVLHGLGADPEPGDLSVLRILANQAAVSLHTSEQYQSGLVLHRKAQLLYDEATAQAQDLAARTDQLRRTEQRLLAAHQRELLDTERHRIARELHDSVTQHVLSAGMVVEVARCDAVGLGAAGVELGERLEQVRQFTAEAVVQLRRAIYSLHQHHGAEDVSPLPDLLHEMIDQHRAHLQLQLRVEGTQVPLGAEAEHELARAAAEALFNVATHGQAARAQVRLRYRPHQLFLSVADDGAGDPTYMARMLRIERRTTGDGRHRGLVNMATRVEALGGRLAFRRARLGGVRVELRVPVPVGTLPRAVPGTGGTASGADRWR